MPQSIPPKPVSSHPGTYAFMQLPENGRISAHVVRETHGGWTVIEDFLLDQDRPAFFEKFARVTIPVKNSLTPGHQQTALLVNKDLLDELIVTGLRVQTQDANGNPISETQINTLADLQNALPPGLHAYEVLGALPQDMRQIVSQELHLKQISAAQSAGAFTHTVQNQDPQAPQQYTIRPQSSQIQMEEPHPNGSASFYLLRMDNSSGSLSLERDGKPVIQQQTIHPISPVLNTPDQLIQKLEGLRAQNTPSSQQASTNPK